MEAMLKATEVAQLMGCSKEYVTRMAREGRLEHEKTLNERNRPIVVNQQGREIIIMAGRPAYYPSHNEVPATLTKERA